MLILKGWGKQALKDAKWTISAILISSVVLWSVGAAVAHIFDASVLWLSLMFFGLGFFVLQILRLGNCVQQAMKFYWLSSEWNVPFAEVEEAFVVYDFAHYDPDYRLLNGKGFRFRFDLLKKSTVAIDGFASIDPFDII